MRPQPILWLVCTLVLSLFGCTTVGPDYRAVLLPSPSQWAAKQAPQAAGEQLERARWWSSFEDPMLNWLIDEALRSNLDLEQARLRIDQARSGLVQSASAGLPSVTGSGSFSRSGNNVPAGVPSFAMSGVTNTIKAGVDTQWEVDLFGATRRSVEATTADLDATIADSQGILLALLADVAIQYGNLRAAQEQIRLTEKTVDLLRESVELTRQRNKLGLVSGLDIAQAETQLALTTASLPTLRSTARQSIHRLSVLLGGSPASLVASLSRPSPLPDVRQVSAAGLPSELLARRPDLRKVERQLAAASARVGVAVAGLYPKLDLTFGLGLRSSEAAEFARLSSRYWSLAPGISIPLFDRGKGRALVTQREAAHEEWVARYLASFHVALEEVENALTNWYGENERHELLDMTVQSAREAFLVAQARYRRGLTGYLDVLDAQRILFTHEISLIQTKAKLLSGAIVLYKALGGGWDAFATQCTRLSAPCDLTPVAQSNEPLVKINLPKETK